MREITLMFRPGLVASMVKVMAWVVEMPRHGLSVTYKDIFYDLADTPVENVTNEFVPN